jgi:hypothetical protein
MNNLREVIYSLKQIFGTPIDVYSEVSAPVLNPETGKNTITFTKQRIKKAVVVSGQLYNLVSVLGNRTTKNSGIIESDVTEFVIDSHDFKGQLTLKDYIDYNDERYDISKITQLTRNNKCYGWFITARKGSTSLLNKQADQVLQDTLVFAQEFILS